MNDNDVKVQMTEETQLFSIPDSLQEDIRERGPWDEDGSSFPPLQSCLVTSPMTVLCTWSWNNYTEGLHQCQCCQPVTLTRRKSYKEVATMPEQKHSITRCPWGSAFQFWIQTQLSQLGQKSIDHRFHQSSFEPKYLVLMAGAVFGKLLRFYKTRLKQINDLQTIHRL